MPRCGWQAGRFSIAGKQERGYCRTSPPTEAPEECRQWFKEQPADGSYHRVGECWINGSGGQYKLKDQVVLLKKDKSGFWYAVLGRELLGQAGRPRRFSTFADARAAIDCMVAGSGGWEWVACEPQG
jgi:hypothetical protein